MVQIQMPKREETTQSKGVIAMSKKCLVRVAEELIIQQVINNRVVDVPAHLKTRILNIDITENIAREALAEARNIIIRAVNIVREEIDTQMIAIALMIVMSRIIIEAAEENMQPPNLQMMMTLRDHRKKLLRFRRRRKRLFRRILRKLRDKPKNLNVMIARSS